MPRTEQSKLLYDGNCPMCTAFANHVEAKDEAPKLIDANKLEAPPVPISRLLDEIHLYEETGTLRTGADAILTTIGRIHPWFMSVARLFRLPGLSHLARFAYRFIADRRTLWFGGGVSRLYWVFLITNLGLLSSVLLTWPLWGNSRTYPLVPILPELSFLSPYTTLVAILLAISTAYALITIKRQRESSIITITLLLILVATDITRLQPWVWHYGMLLLLFSFWRTTAQTITKSLISAMSIVVVGIYFWSGIQKMNAAFYLDIFPWFTKTLWEPLGTIGMYTFFVLGIFTPFIESAIAIGLLTRTMRRTALIAALAMFTLVIASLMFGHDWNSSVWPWNVALLGMAIALFWGSKDTLQNFWSNVRTNRFAHITIALFIIMPLGNFFGITDHYLSWSLYSGHVPTAYITADSALIETLAPSAPTIPDNNGDGTLSFVHFAMSTLNAVPYPETRVFESIFDDLCKRYPYHELTFHIINRPIVYSRQTEIDYYTCPQ
jgi:predicted DCC family thiol-disulfide oxidoreductase YuxK